MSQQLTLDRDAETVRIVKKVDSHTAPTRCARTRSYLSLRIELQTYRLLDGALAKQFITGELYQYYVLPQIGRGHRRREYWREKVSRYLL